MADLVSTAPENFDPKSVKMRCCVQKDSATSVCINCYGLYHNSCMKRMQNIHHLGGNKIACCEVSEEDDENPNTATRYLKLLLGEVQDKNKVLQLNNSLLLDKIRYLEEKLRDSSESMKIEQEKNCVHINITNEPEIKSDNITRQLSNKTETSQEEYSNALKSSTKSSKTVQPKTTSQNKQISQIQLQQALNEVRNKPIVDKIANQDEETWTVKTNKSNRRPKPPKRLGTAKVSNSEFCGTVKKVWIYLYRINNTATEQKIKEYITKSESFKEEKLTVKEIPGNPDKPKRFVVCAPFSKKDELYNPEFWPENVGIRRFDFQKHQTFLQQQEASFL